MKAQAVEHKLLPSVSPEWRLLSSPLALNILWSLCSLFLLAPYRTIVTVFFFFQWEDKFFVVYFTHSKKIGNSSKLEWKNPSRSKNSFGWCIPGWLWDRQTGPLFLSEPQPWTSVPKYSGFRLPAKEALEVKGLTFLKKLYLANKDFD